jgi:hypothetical protein
MTKIFYFYAFFALSIVQYAQIIAQNRHKGKAVAAFSTATACF